MRRRRSLFALLAVAAIIGSIWSYVFLVTPRQQTLDQRVYDVASQLKCLVCQGESVADSPATLSQQMRGIIRQQLQSGKAEQEGLQYFESRYGERILGSPPWQGFTLLAWLVPVALLLGGTVLLCIVLRDWPTRSAKGPAEENEGAGLEDMDEKDMEYYRQQLEQELAAEDSIFARRGTEAN